MADLTVYAEALIATVARAFYDDDAICLIDVLLRDKFLRDDDMAPRLSLPAKRLRATLQFLTEEHLVRSETVDDLQQGGSQTTKFYYLDYNRAVHSIRLRLATLRQRLEADEMRARSSSFYLCPGYKLRRCNGRYTEQEAQQRLDMNTGLFLCRECVANFENDPSPPPLATYTLQLVDNEKDLREAVDNLRRFNVQLSVKFIGSQQLRPGIYDLLQKVRGKQQQQQQPTGSSTGTGTGTSSSGTTTGSSSSSNRKPITSNLPSENFALGIGSTRLAGTGRTAGIKISKLQKQGLAESAAQAKNYLVGAMNDDGTLPHQSGVDDPLAPGGGGAGGFGIGFGNSGYSTETALMFLKSAHGHEIQFTVTRGGGARAQVLATGRANNTNRTRGRSRRKLLDAAASRVGSSLAFPVSQ
jgi:transcription initiation factor IIE alpha subunit